jgi:small subunit ribosomal protein S4
LFLKGTKCFTEKCPVERRPYAPGQHGQTTARRRKVSEYAKQLREKQKVKRIYGVSEKQFRNTFERVTSLPGLTGHNLLAALESRLDNIVYRMGFAASRKAARQLIRHRHVEVNGRPVDIPSYLVTPGEEVRIRQKSREQVSIAAAMDQAQRGAPISWIAVDRDTYSGRVLERPGRHDIPIAAQEQLIVELYSK